MRQILLALVLATSCGGSGVRLGAADQCESKVPADLRRAIAEKFNGYRLPRVSDNLEEDIDYNRRTGGDGCLGVASADFNGDSQRDYGLLLRLPEGDRVLLVAALHGSEGWSLEELRLWKSERNRLYVATASPGEYRRSESFDYPPSEEGELEVYKSTLSGIVTGRTEASGIYYFWTPHGWVHVWVTD